MNHGVIRTAMVALNDEIDELIDRYDDDLGIRDELEHEQRGVQATIVVVNAVIANMPIGAQVRLAEDRTIVGTVMNPREAWKVAAPDDFETQIPVLWTDGEHVAWEFIEDLKPHRD